MDRQEDAIETASKVQGEKEEHSRSTEAGLWVAEKAHVERNEGFSQEQDAAGSLQAEFEEEAGGIAQWPDRRGGFCSGENRRQSDAAGEKNGCCTADRPSL